MSYLVLARKYRPQTFDEVVEQSHITRTLVNAIELGRMAHAIIFSGPRGTGKTTVARILAKAMNCSQGPTGQPCNRCRSCQEITAGGAADVYEIDGASNNTVDQVRELRENVRYRPSHSPYKIYIIDEVHMLTNSAFNALLKTLEEPPPHVMFLFATTEAHKVPVTILSRCQRHDFRRISTAALVGHMEQLCRQEEVQVAVESLGIIAREAGGSMRDALSLLDQLIAASAGSVTHERVLDILGVIDRQVINDLSAAVLAADAPAMLAIVSEVYTRGQDLKRLYADLVEHFRNLLLVSMGPRAVDLVDLPDNEVESLRQQAAAADSGSLLPILDLLFSQEPAVRFAVQPRPVLEMALLRVRSLRPALPIDTLIEKIDRLYRRVPVSVDDSGRRGPEPAENRSTPSSGGQAAADGIVEIPAGEGPGSDEPAPGGAADSPDAWGAVMEMIGRKHPALGASLKRAAVRRPGPELLEVVVNGSEFNLKRVRRDRKILEQVCREVLGPSLTLKIQAGERLDADQHRRRTKNSELKQKALSDPLVADAVEVFNGEIVEVRLTGDKRKRGDSP